MTNCGIRNMSYVINKDIHEVSVKQSRFRSNTKNLIDSYKSVSSNRITRGQLL